jgi:uncharacterized protein (TIGR02246 family)
MTRWLFAFLLAASPLAAQETPEALQQAFLDAVRAGDAAAVAALYAEDAVSYPMGVSDVHGPDGVREDWESFFEAFTVNDIILDGHSEVLGDTALAWGLWKMIYSPKEGGEAEIMDGRFTDIAKKIDGRWRYVVDHASLPLLDGE